MEPLSVVLVADIKGLQDKETFEKHLKREGFKPIPDEPFSYIGETTTPKINTVLYIFDAVEKGMKKSGFDDCKIIFQIGEYPMEGYRYDRAQDKFIGVDL